MKKPVSVIDFVRLALVRCLFLTGCRSNERPSSTNEKPSSAASALETTTARPALPVVVATVVVTNGMFRIDFTSNIENLEINAIEIIPQT